MVSLCFSLFQKYLSKKRGAYNCGGITYNAWGVIVVAKIENDKYYTPIELANYCIDRTLEIIGKENIADVIEPSCGNLSFFHNQYLVPNIGIDIQPQTLPMCPKQPHHYDIIVGDFLKIQIPYRSGRLIIGNPPYGEKLQLAIKFYKKSTQIGDYISFILPISQLNNSNSMYEFDLVYSEDLGIKEYSGRALHCCLNIYKRGVNGINNKPVNKLYDVTFKRNDSIGYDDFDFDLRMCYWVNGAAGKILKDGEHYSAEYKIKINNPHLKDKIIDVITDFDWKNYLNCIAMLKIQQHHIVQVLRKYIPEIK